MTIKDLEKALIATWSVETAYSGDRKNWTPEHNSIGQCTVTAMIVYDFFGGRIVRGYSEKYKLFHYWNEIDGKKLDLTFNQFSYDKSDIVFTKVIYKSKKDLMKIRSVRSRYLLLKRKVDEYFKEI